MVWLQSKQNLLDLAAVFAVSGLGLLALSQNFGNTVLLSYVCLIFGIDIWVWSQYFIKKSLDSNPKPQKPEIWEKNTDSENSKFWTQILSFTKTPHQKNDLNSAFKLNLRRTQKGVITPLY